MKLRKEDPIYYKEEMKKLINQARENGLELSITVDFLQKPAISPFNDVRLNFEASNGDIASVHLLKVGG